MGSTQSHLWERRVLGEPHCHPGHPLVIALAIMDRYESLAHAQEPIPGATYCRARGDSFVPGTGDAVCAALDVLELALSNRPNGMFEAYREAERYWEGWEQQSPRNVGHVGREQADRIKALFIERVLAWRSSKLLSSVDRLV